MRRVYALGLILLVSAIGALAQDERRVTSPDGQIEFRLFLDKPDPASLFRLAYQVYFHGKRLINTSFLGLEIHNQPVLGENVGLIASKTESTDRYRSLVAEYMQNGSLGRRINMEVRVYNDGVAFRYFVPQSTPLMKMLLENEATEFEFVQDAETYPSHLPVSRIAPKAVMPLPFVVEQPGIGWVSITETPAGNYPRMYLSRTDGKIMISRLPPLANESDFVWEGKTPLTCPWRVLVIGATRASVTESKIENELKP